MPRSIGVVTESSRSAADLPPRAVVAAQLRGESKTRRAGPRAMMKAVAEELRALGLEPKMDELGRRYRGGPSRVRDHLRRTHPR